MTTAVRSRMTHRATVERNTGFQLNDWNQRIPEFTVLHTALPCYAQARIDRTVADGEKFVVIGTHIMLVPTGADLKGGGQSDDGQGQARAGTGIGASAGLSG